MKKIKIEKLCKSKVALRKFIEEKSRGLETFKVEVFNYTSFYDNLINTTLTIAFTDEEGETEYFEFAQIESEETNNNDENDKIMYAQRKALAKLKDDVIKYLFVNFRFAGTITEGYDGVA